MEVKKSWLRDGVPLKGFVAFLVAMLPIVLCADVLPLPPRQPEPFEEMFQPEGFNFLLKDWWAGVLAAGVAVVVFVGILKTIKSAGNLNGLDKIIHYVVGCFILPIARVSIAYLCYYAICTAILVWGRFTDRSERFEVIGQRSYSFESPSIPKWASKKQRDAYERYLQKCRLEWYDYEKHIRDYHPVLPPRNPSEL